MSIYLSSNIGDYLMFQDVTLCLFCCFNSMIKETYTPIWSTKQNNTSSKLCEQNNGATKGWAKWKDFCVGKNKVHVDPSQFH
jgi:hypothetical protein